MSLSALPGLASAAEGSYKNYVTDAVDVPVRKGADYKFKISHMLKSGTPVTILTVDSAGWANVEFMRSGKTVTGWMPTSVLQNEPVAKERLSAQMAKTTAVEQKHNALLQELDTLKARFDSTELELTAIKQENFELTQELTRLKSISSNALELDEENQTMKKRLSAFETDNAIMKEQIDASNDAIQRQWFLTGGGVLLLGLLLGRFFRLPNKRKKWDSF
ncbi:TIGR04211 family SH3 domain-containing protein [Thiomicrorhabdus aquaedulcis]|uniref:TIGR04211 family SH3 domain-containing protein n=1 Tax=Thiomicrorhabdus aquaedulcis TaxID=2211106 RepID=UPI001E49203D|nr:TIGR04211 family SH3 domain-containing protein [Thiomicrorhabdus aquaedulcis]